MKLSFLVVMACLPVAWADVHSAPRDMIHRIRKGVAGCNPYIFLTAPNGRSKSILQGFKVIEENDNEYRKMAVNDDFDNEDEELDNDEEDITEYVNDTDEDYQDGPKLVDAEKDEHRFVEEEDDDEDNSENDNDELDNIMNLSLKQRKTYPQTKNAKATQMMISRQHAGAIMVPDEVIEIEAPSVIDDQTGKAALWLPRVLLDSIPQGSVVALMKGVADGDDSEERDNHVVVRRRRKGTRSNIKRRTGGNNRFGVVTRSSNKPLNNSRRQNVIVVRRGNGRNGNKLRYNNRRRIYLQG